MLGGPAAWLLTFFLARSPEAPNTTRSIRYVRRYTLQAEVISLPTNDDGVLLDLMMGSFHRRNSTRCRSSVLRHIDD